MIKIIINIRKDAWNWWHACNKISFSVDWKKRIPLSMQKKIVGRSQTVAYEFILPHLRELYRKLNITKIKNEIDELFKQKQNDLFKRLETITGKKLYRRKFTLFLTTFPRAPYNYNKGYIWMPAMRPKEVCLVTFVHELLHFQTYAYWQKICLKQITREQFEDLKEALTVVLGDEGYECHKILRSELLKYWKKNKDFDALVRYGIRMIRG